MRVRRYRRDEDVTIDLVGPGQHIGITLDARIDNTRKAARRKASGDTIESYFERTHGFYALQRRAVFTKMNPPVFGPPTALKYAGSSWVDFVGSIAPNGRMCAVDIKGITRSQWLKAPDLLPLTAPAKKQKMVMKDRERLKRQAELMMSLQDVGAVVAFICVDKKLERAWLVTDVAKVARLEPVQVRDRQIDLVPSVPFASVHAMSLGAPPVDYLPTLLACYGVAS